MAEEIIQKILSIQEISPAVHNFIAAGKYIDPTEEHAIEPMEVLINCKQIIIVELKEMGIECLDIEMNLLDGYRGEVILLLRSIFETENMKTFIQRLNDDELDVFKELVNNKDDIDSDFGLDLIIGYMLNFNPNNKDIEKIKYYASDYYVTDKFYDNIFEVIKNKVTFNYDTVDQNANIVAYLRYKFSHTMKVKLAAEFFRTYKFKEPLNVLEFDKQMSMHDEDLMKSPLLKEVVNCWHLKQQRNPNPEMLKIGEEIEQQHHKSNRHHLEFHVGKEDQMSMVDDIEIVCDIYNDQDSKEEYIDDVRKTISDIAVSNTTKERIISLANLLNLW